MDSGGSQSKKANSFGAIVSKGRCVVPLARPDHRQSLSQLKHSSLADHRVSFLRCSSLSPSAFSRATFPPCTSSALLRQVRRAVRPTISGSTQTRASWPELSTLSSTPSRMRCGTLSSSLSASSTTGARPLPDHSRPTPTSSSCSTSSRACRRRSTAYSVGLN